MTLMTRFSNLPRLSACAAGALMFCVSAQAQVISFDIAAGDMKAALDAYAAQSGAQLIYKTEDVKGLASKGVKRLASAEDALTLLLDGTALKVRRDPSGAVVIYVDTGPKPDKRAEADDGPHALGTVVVSASRRREPVREVPMQVNILSADELNRAGAKSLKDYLSNEAGVDLNSFGSAGVGSISMRGVTTGNQTIATVGIYVDDVSVGSNTAFAKGAQLALDMALLDLHHIELLRGPQGTLYGAGAMGGLLKYVTNEPDTSEFSGSGTLTVAGTRHGRIGSTASAVLNVPLKADVAGLRVSAFRDSVGGYVDAVGPAARADADRGDTTGLRASALISPSRQFKVRLTATTQKIRREGMEFVDYDNKTGQPVEGELRRRLFAAEAYTNKVNLYSADLEYDFGWMRVNAITAQQKQFASTLNDLSTGYLPLLAGFGMNLGSATALLKNDNKKLTQEFRLTSKADKHWEWLGGLFYAHEQTGNQQLVASSLPGGAAGPDLATASLPADYKELAAYGDLTWKTGPWSVTGGLRIAHNKQHYMQQSDGLLVGGKTSLVADSSDTSKTWLLTARYALTPTSGVYARGATGYRPGGPNAVAHDPVSGAPLAPTTFQPDSLASYELGYKADLLDRALSLEAAAYRIDWKNLQQYYLVNAISVITNAGKAKVQGAELSLSYRPGEHLTLAASAALIDAKLSEDAKGLGASAGARLPSSARFSASLSANYSFAWLGHPAYVGLTQRYVGERNAGFDGSATVPNYKIPAYSLTDLQAGIAFKRISLSLFARNLFDARAQISANSLLVPLGGPQWVVMAQPRTLGASLNLTF